MRQARLVGFGIAAVLWAGPALAQGATGKPAAGRDSLASRLTANEQKVQDALMKKDVAAFNRLVEADGWAVDETGYMKVADFVKSIPDLKLENARLEDVKVLPVSPTVSILTYKLNQKGTYQGQPVPPLVYATTVWVNRGGTWRAAFHQETTPAAPKK